MAFVFGLQTLQLINFSKIYQLKGMMPKNKGHTNFYECCELTEKVYLASTHTWMEQMSRNDEVFKATFLWAKRTLNAIWGWILIRIEAHTYSIVLFWITDPMVHYPKENNSHEPKR